MDHFEDIINNTILKISKERDERILQAFRDHGYEFKTQKELAHFIETRCEIIAFDFSKRKILKVDGIEILEWWDTFHTYYKDGVVTFIAGEPE